MTSSRSLSQLARGALSIGGAVAVLAAVRPAAAADDACPPAALAKSGYRPVLPSEIACAVKLGKPMTVALACKLGTPSGSRSYVMPGMKVDVLAPATSPVRIQIKTPDGKEGDVDYSCMSWSDTGVSLAPNPKAKNTIATVKTILKQLFTARKALRKDMYTFMEKRDFVRPKDGTPDQVLFSAQTTASENYGKIMHNFIYGASMSTTNLLTLDENKWLADWPDIVLDTYSKGLTGKDKDGAEPAESSLNKRAQVLNWARDREVLKDQEAAADDKVKDVPEAKRASEKKKILDEIAAKKKDLGDKMKEWQKDADKTEKKVKL